MEESFVVLQGNGEVRLDKFLTEKLDITRSYIKTLIDFDKCFLFLI